MSLCDQQLTIAGMDLGVQIDVKEFETAWKLSNRELMVTPLRDIDLTQKIAS